VQQLNSNAKETFIHEIFSAIARRYDLINSLLSFNRDKNWRRYAVEKCELKTGGIGLDVCCGTGMLTIEQARCVGMTGKVIGLDFCRDMLEIAVGNIAKTPFASQIELLEGNAMKLPFADNTFDCATIGFALRNVLDLRTVISEMQRVVRNGGAVVSLELAKPSAPVFKQLYYLYFEKMLPLLGKLGTGIDGPYQWLPRSLQLFPHQADIHALFQDVGFKESTYYELDGGIVAVHVGKK